MSKIKFETDLQIAKDLSGWILVSELATLGIASRTDAEAAGYAPYRSVKNPARYALVATTFDRGIPAMSHRAYVSVWAISMANLMSRVGFYMCDFVHFCCSHCGALVKSGEGSIAEAEKHHAAHALAEELREKNQ